MLFVFTDTAFDVFVGDPVSGRMCDLCGYGEVRSWAGAIQQAAVTVWVTPGTHCGGEWQALGRRQDFLWGILCQASTAL